MIVREMIRFECESIKKKDDRLGLECKKKSIKYPIQWSFKLIYYNGRPESQILYSFSKMKSNCIGIDLKIKAKVFKPLGISEYRSNTRYIEEEEVLKFSIPTPGFNVQHSNIEELVNIEFYLEYRFVKEKYDFDEDTVLTNVKFQLRNGVAFANKHLLAMNSKYFEALCFGYFLETGEHKVDIDVDKDDFVEFLNYAYNYATEFYSERDCRIVMKLADRFDMKHVRLECDDFLPIQTHEDLFNREPENKLEFSKILIEFVQQMPARQQQENEPETKNESLEKYEAAGSLKDFSVESEYSDSILDVNGKTLHVSKYMLAAKSPVFKAMFFDGEECDKNEFVIKGVKTKEFVVFLQYVCNFCIRATEENFEFLLELADMFEIEFIKRICEKYIIDKVEHHAEKLTEADKWSLLDIADTYSLPRAHRFYILNKLAPPP